MQLNNEMQEVFGDGTTTMGQHTEAGQNMKASPSKLHNQSHTQKCNFPDLANKTFKIPFKKGRKK